MSLNRFENTEFSNQSTPNNFYTLCKNIPMWWSNWMKEKIVIGPEYQNEREREREREIKRMNERKNTSQCIQMESNEHWTIEQHQTNSVFICTFLCKNWLHCIEAYSTANKCLNAYQNFKISWNWSCCNQIRYFSFFLSLYSVFPFYCSVGFSLEIRAKNFIHNIVCLFGHHPTNTQCECAI